jgi:hypothetical protein
MYCIVSVTEKTRVNNVFGAKMAYDVQNRYKAVSANSRASEGYRLISCGDGQLHGPQLPLVYYTVRAKVARTLHWRCDVAQT